MVAEYAIGKYKNHWGIARLYRGGIAARIKSRCQNLGSSDRPVLKRHALAKFKPVIPYAQIIKTRRQSWEQEQGRRMRDYEEWLALYPENQREKWGRFAKVQNSARRSDKVEELDNAIRMGDRLLISLNAKVRDIPRKIRRHLKTK